MRPSEHLVQVLHMYHILQAGIFRLLGVSPVINTNF